MGERKNCKSLEFRNLYYTPDSNGFCNKPGAMLFRIRSLAMRVPLDYQSKEPALSLGDMLNVNKIELSKISNKRVEIDFDGGRITSDAGVLFIREVERQIGIMKAVAGCIKDKRDQRYVKQEMELVIRQRVTQISCGYEDANDCNTLRNDPAIKNGR